VQDLGSRNGTRVARHRLRGGEPVALSVGESFQIGGFSFVVLRAPGSRSPSTRGSAAEALCVIDPSPAGAGAVVADIARSDINVLILGETGVGKEVLAGTLHQLSGRKGTLVSINCAALTPSLFESELFGHEKGAFTGAAQARAGLLEAAAGGTVFLDEVGELSPEAQAKLLRAIETREITRVGAVKSTHLDVRFVAATNRDLGAAVATGRFRADLFFRLDGVTLVIPPLRERRDRIGPLALQFLKEAHARLGQPGPLRVSQELLPRLETLDWPGNVRELKSVLERALLLARGEVGVKHLAPARTRPAPPEREAELPPRAVEERQRIVNALDACAGNQTRAAKLLGVSRATLVTKLAIYRIPRPRV
jgi:DNA-binding NtrC family response regulator